MSLRATAISGAKLTTATSVAVSGLQFVPPTVVGRLLCPCDFGLLDMGMAVIGFAEYFTDVGLGSGITQPPEKSPAELSSLFWLNVFAGTAVFSLTIAATPLVVL